MANPIIPSGRRRRLEWLPDGSDIAEAARRQDEERRIREDDEHFERTGENRPPRQFNDPLVDNDRPNVAYDGDTYAEDAPTRIILPDAEDDLRGIYGIDIGREIRNLRAAERINTVDRNTRAASRSEREAYVQREQEINNKEFQAKVEKTKKKYTSAIKGLQLDDE